MSWRSGLKPEPELEGQLERKLNLAPGVRSIHQTIEAGSAGTSTVRTGRPHTAAGLARAVLAPPAGRHAEDRRVGQVDELSRKGHVDPLRDREVFDQVQVCGLEAGPPQ